MKYERIQEMEPSELNALEFKDESVNPKSTITLIEEVSFRKQNNTETQQEKRKQMIEEMKRHFGAPLDFDPKRRGSMKMPDDDRDLIKESVENSKGIYGYGTPRLVAKPVFEEGEGQERGLRNLQLST